MNQPLFIQYAYLDFKDNEAVDDFFEALKEEVEANMRIPVLGIIKTRSSGLQKEIIEILNAWHTNTVGKAGIDDWLQEHRPISVFCVGEGDELGTSEVYHERLEKRDVCGLLVYLIIADMEAGKEIRQCAAEDCDKYFVPTPRGKNQRFCSGRCRKRFWAQTH